MQRRWMVGTGVVLLGVLIGVPAAQAQQGRTWKVTEEQPGLLAKATITPDSAGRVALSKAPGGQIEKAEIEIEDKVLVYSFDIKVRGRDGVTEVLVDARSGAVVSVEHEDAAKEAQEHEDAGHEAEGHDST